MYLLALAAFVAVTEVSPPSGVTPTLLARGTYDAFMLLSTTPGSPVDFKAKSKSPIDVVVRMHDYAVGSTTGMGFVDNGRGHIVRNVSGLPAQDVSVIIEPVGGAFRGDLDAPGPYCDF